MLLPARQPRDATLERRTISNEARTSVIVGSIAGVIFIILIVTYFTTRKYRTSSLNTQKAQQSSNDKLPSLFSWKNFRKRPRRNGYSTTLQDTEYRGSASRASGEMRGASTSDPERQITTANAAGVDRNTSIRSVMTLPAYSSAARENERVLAREGERAGMDNVIELPETVEDEERQREEEMESLYQIRLARRIEAADREARRQARREARARGDVQALADIRRRAEEAADLSVSQMLIAEHQTRTRTREQRVSSVAYGDLGVARHDGTRIRGNSTESDIRPLLDSAASFSGHSRNETHQRGLSITSLAQSVESRPSEDYDFADASRSNSHSASGSDGFEIIPLHPESSNHSHSHSEGGSLPSPQMHVLPEEEAPAYEDPPNYESPVDTHAPQLPALNLNLERLPSIRIVTETTPADARAASPIR
ncbi:hypothetical protein P3342_011159 [Pyrenophora teres f. teres]|uniref:Uncharacterized protein n=1 Tax=Pyrenophora teres f. teres TaxID=97479 RepID=A0A6S6WI87_9PLEO|nr:hypothetical protein PTNB85_09339 [Pyrenophora teres f. teres]KAE8831987.1 hypothetical protein HRS9139_06229 [Pyrenophora teres f. teres]KAE8835276.1 hypothetical protein HRS9122_07546 [Pyrenophora teres f. teres]KAE8858177.1 hypothetical protein PTNB29_07392 [Pyrenophora teres f. teres]KAE8861985.1 hypothetical protein PTNB73_07539 [Pyrenophora teres f. teres]